MPEDVHVGGHEGGRAARHCQTKDRSVFFLNLIAGVWFIRTLHKTYVALYLRERELGRTGMRLCGGHGARGRDVCDGGHGWWSESERGVCRAGGGVRCRFGGAPSFKRVVHALATRHSPAGSGASRSCVVRTGQRDRAHHSQPIPSSPAVEHARSPFSAFWWSVPTSR